MRKGVKGGFKKVDIYINEFYTKSFIYKYNNI